MADQFTSQSVDFCPFEIVEFLTIEIENGATIHYADVDTFIAEDVISHDRPPCSRPRAGKTAVICDNSEINRRPHSRATFPRLTLCSKIVALRHISAANADAAALFEAASIHRRASLVLLALSELIGSAAACASWTSPHFVHLNVRCSKPGLPDTTRSTSMCARHIGQQCRWVSRAECL